jgi:hypothetical protein
MKKLLLSIIIILISFPALAIWPFNKDKEEPPKLVKCHYMLNYHEDERGRKKLFIFMIEMYGKCMKLAQVGELNEQNHYFAKYKGQSRVLWAIYGGDTERTELINSSWGGELYPIEIYEGPTDNIPKDE